MVSKASLMKVVSLQNGDSEHFEGVNVVMLSRSNIVWLKTLVLLPAIAFQLILLVWSFYMSWTAGGLLGGWTMQVSLALISVTFCIALAEGYKTPLWVPAVVLGLFFELLGGYVVFSYLSSQTNTLQPAQLETLLTEYQQDKQRELERFKPYALRAEQKAQKGQALGSDLLEVTEEHKQTLAVIQIKIDEVRGQLNTHHHKAGYENISEQMSLMGYNMSGNQIEGWVNWFRIIGLVICFSWAAGLPRRLNKALDSYFLNKYEKYEAQKVPTEREVQEVQGVQSVRPESDASIKMIIKEQATPTQVKPKVEKIMDEEEVDTSTLYSEWLKDVLLGDLKPHYLVAQARYQVDENQHEQWIERALFESDAFRCLIHSRYKKDFQKKFESNKAQTLHTSNTQSMKPALSKPVRKVLPSAGDQETSKRLASDKPKELTASKVITLQPSQTNSSFIASEFETEYLQMIEDIRADKLALKWKDIKAFYGRKTQEIWWSKFIKWGIEKDFIEKIGRSYQLKDTLIESDVAALKDANVTASKELMR